MNMPCRYCESFDVSVGDFVNLCNLCGTTTTINRWNKPVEYRGFHIQLREYAPIGGSELEWLDHEYDPLDGESGPGDTAETLADARQQIDDHLYDLQHEEWSKENEQD